VTVSVAKPGVPEALVMDKLLRIHDTAERPE